MAQSFVTTYNNDFRREPIEKVDPIRPDQILFEKCDEHKDRWLVVKSLVHDRDDDESYARAVAAVKELHRKRFISTYQTDYPSRREQDESEMNNGLLMSNKLLYEKVQGQVLPPLNSCRRINGYIRPSRLFTPYTTYQNEIGRNGYEILKKPPDM